MLVPGGRERDREFGWRPVLGEDIAEGPARSSAGGGREAAMGGGATPLYCTAAICIRNTK